MSVISFIGFTIAALFLYRSIYSLLILCHKIQVIDEQNYIYLFYISCVCAVVAFTKNITIGIVGLCLTPVVLIIYFMTIRRRIYWIVAGTNTNVSRYGNALIEYDEKYKDGYYTKNHITVKRVESKIQVIFEDLPYEEKEKILKIFKGIAKENDTKFNGKQLLYLLLNFIVFSVFLSIAIVYF